MNSYLILQLDAPMVSYGNVAVDVYRPTDTFPGRSMLTGMIANAMGWRRRDHDLLDRLQEHIRYAARVDSKKIERMTDFQTVALGEHDQAWTTNGRPEGRAGNWRSYTGSELRYPDYLVESSTVVALTVEHLADDLPTVDDMNLAIRWPARPLFIGRKSCFPSSMMSRGTLLAECATEAIHQYSPPHAVDGHPIQWDEDAFHESVVNTRERWVSDMRDWANQVHTGRRLVYEGLQVVTRSVS